MSKVNPSEIDLDKIEHGLLTHLSNSTQWETIQDLESVEGFDKSQGDKLERLLGFNLIIEREENSVKQYLISDRGRMITEVGKRLISRLKGIVKRYEDKYLKELEHSNDRTYILRILGIILLSFTVLFIIPLFPFVNESQLRILNILLVCILIIVAAIETKTKDFKESDKSAKLNNTLLNIDKEINEVLDELDNP